MAALAGLNADQIQAISALVEGLNLGRGDRRGGLPHVKNIPCPIYSIGDDFDTWIVAFTDNVRAVYSLDEADAHLPGLIIKWISTKLASGATRAAFDNLEPAVKRDWTLLKPALTECFTDEKDKLSFLARMDAHKRQPGQSLRTYKDSLLIKMEKYQGALKGVPQEWRRSASQRFREGLDNPMLKAHLMLNCGDDSTIDEAFKVATSWENTIAQLGNSAKGNGAESVVSALMGLPTVSEPAAVRPRMSALAMGATENDDPLSKRMGALETKVRHNELQIAEVKDTVSCIKVGMEEVKRDITKGFGDLRRDLAQGPASRLNQPSQQQAGTRYTPAYRDFHQPQRAPFPQRNPTVVPGLTPGSSYVNKPISIAQRPVSGYNVRAPNYVSQQRSGGMPRGPVMGAVGGTPTAEETEPKGWILDEEEIQVNMGNGWEVFPGAGQNPDYNMDPRGVLNFQEPETVFQKPADCPQGDPLA